MQELALFQRREKGKRGITLCKQIRRDSCFFIRCNSTYEIVRVGRFFSCKKKQTTSWWKRGLQEETVWRINLEELTTRGTIVIIATE